MDPDKKMNVAAGETDEMPPPPRQGQPAESASVTKDRAYSPASEVETEQKQRDPLPETTDSDIDPDDVRAVPGAGGPDDTGDVDVDPDDLNMPGRG
ncbi:hypothetical protein [Microbacterium marmarense]|uniref:Multidrug transporter n=1 Tax=Microbacterium marmarense TaxID=3122051 RepID=A0ABU8LRH0_9MICO